MTAALLPIFASFSQPVKHLTPFGKLVGVNVFHTWLQQNMLTASEIPDRFAVSKPELNSCTFQWKPDLLWLDFLSGRRITTLPNYVLSLLNCCCHSSPHAAVISCVLARFQEPLPPPPSICTPVNRLRRTKWVRGDEKRSEEREGLCTPE